MKELTVISGKGGTGKTSLAASFAVLAKKPVLADCDVDASDLPLILSPKVQFQEDFSGGKRAKILTDKCNNCGECFEVCRFKAVVEEKKYACFPDGSYSIDPIACEGCGVCAWFCPQEAIEFKQAVNGKWFISDTRCGVMVHARLGMAEENSGKLVTIVRKAAKEIAEKNSCEYIIVDGSPGIGCPVIASITGADLVVIVTEPTLSGEHDLERVVDLAKHFDIPAIVCINKFDINPGVAGRIEETARRLGISLAGNIRYDKAVTKAQIIKASVVEYTAGAVTQDIKTVWRNVVQLLNAGE